MTAEEIATIFSAPGLYVLQDTRCPGSTIPVVTLTDQDEATGEPITMRVFMLERCHELSPDPAQWERAKQASLAGGPFSVQKCEQLEKDGERLFQLETAVAEAVEFAKMYRELCLKSGFTNAASAMQIMIETLTPETQNSPTA